MSFIVCGNGYVDGDCDYVCYGLGVEDVFFEDYVKGVDCDGYECFEYLDEGDIEVDVGGVGELEGEWEEEFDWDDGVEVKFLGYGCVGFY